MDKEERGGGSRGEDDIGARVGRSWVPEDHPPPGRSRRNPGRINAPAPPSRPAKSRAPLRNPARRPHALVALHPAPPPRLTPSIASSLVGFCWFRLR